MTRNHFGFIGSFLILVMFGIALYLFWVYVAAITIGFISLVLIASVVAGVRWHKVTGLPLEEANREGQRLAHEQEMERERLRILRERHVFDMRLQWEKHELEKHLALTRIPADAKGHYPYMVHPEQGYQALPNVNLRAIAQRSTVSEDEAADDAAQAIPALIEYSQVKASIPQGHALVGISARGLETREDSVRALVWVVGSSGVGKTNTVSIRVDDDYEKGHRFLGVDPHAFKVDSLTNALREYQACFLMPIAQKTEDINQVLDAFLNEFERRKNGGSWSFPITLIVDEVGSMVLDIDKEEQVESDVARKLKMIARICGQESRGFQMYGIYISQDAAGLSWLRKRALMVLAHQVMMMSERLLVCNDDRAIARQMDTWPRGRTLAYGVMFQEGPIVVQQPRFTPRRIVDSDPNPFTRVGRNGNAVNAPETASQAVPLRLVNAPESEGLDAQKSVDTSQVGNDVRAIILRMHRKGDGPRKIAETVGLNGRYYGLFQAVCAELGIKKVEEA